MQLTSLQLGVWEANVVDGKVRLLFNGLSIEIEPHHMADLISTLLMVNPAAQPIFLNPQETADAAGKGRTSVQRAIALGRVPGMIKVGDGTAILAAAVDHIDFGKQGNPNWRKSDDKDEN